MAEHSWVSTNIYSELPADAIVAGHDADGEQIYVGRAYHEGDVLPAKVVPGRQEAYVCYGGEEVKKHDVEILCGYHYAWTHCENGEVPVSAIRCGQTSDGEALFIGRGHWAGTLTPGKIHPSHGCLYIPFGGAEQRLDHYEVLIQPETWVHGSLDAIPPAAIYAGHDADGSPIYVGRSYHSGDMLPAKVIPSKGCAYVAWGGEEHVKHDFELLCGYGYGWVHSSGGHVPANAIVAGHTSDGETLYIGRGSHAGSLTPGKIHPSHGVLYIPFDGSEVSLPVYEVLIRT